MIIIEAKEERGQPIIEINYQPEGERQQKLGATIERFFEALKQGYEFIDINKEMVVLLSPERSAILGSYGTIPAVAQGTEPAPASAVPGGDSPKEKEKATEDQEESEGIQVKDQYPDVPLTFDPVIVKKEVEVPAEEPKAKDPAPEPAKAPKPVKRKKSGFNVEGI